MVDYLTAVFQVCALQSFLRLWWEGHHSWYSGNYLVEEEVLSYFGQQFPQLFSNDLVVGSLDTIQNRNLRNGRVTHVDANLMGFVR
jgi:hypothetical protein